MAKKKEKKEGAKPMDYVIGAAGLFLLGKYLFFPSMSRQDAVNTIIAAGHVSNNYSDETLWGTSYLIAWATAIRKNAPTFKLTSSLYSTQTGKRVA